MSLGRLALIAGAALTAGAAAVVLVVAMQSNEDVTITVDVPRAVAEGAERRAGGDRTAPAPVLMLEAVRLALGQRLTLHVLGPPFEGGRGPAPLLAVSSMVGSAPPPPGAPVLQHDLMIPLNDKALPLLRGAARVTLTLRMINPPAGATLEFARAVLLADPPPLQ
jgi:hypothetical protein